MARTLRLGAIAGAVSPYLFLLGTVAISLLEQDFMEDLGWEVWPSGLALGPHGWLQTANFIVFGALLIAFALAVQVIPALNRATAGAPVLLGIAGLAAMLLAFETDPPDVDETWHGLLHGFAYLTWLACILVAYPLTWWRVRKAAVWVEAPTWSSALSLLLFPPVLLLPDSDASGNYIFFAVVLTPLAAIAIRMALGSARTATGPPAPA